MRVAGLRRHLTEFWMVEPEMAYANLEDVKQVAEELIVFIVGRVLENRKETLAPLLPAKRLRPKAGQQPWVRPPGPAASHFALPVH